MRGEALRGEEVSDARRKRIARGGAGNGARTEEARDGGDESDDATDDGRRRFDAAVGAFAHGFTGLSRTGGVARPAASIAGRSSARRPHPDERAASGRFVGRDEHHGLTSDGALDEIVGPLDPRKCGRQGQPQGGVAHDEVVQAGEGDGIEERHADKELREPVRRVFPSVADPLRNDVPSRDGLPVVGESAARLVVPLEVDLTDRLLAVLGALDVEDVFGREGRDRRRRDRGRGGLDLAHLQVPSEAMRMAPRRVASSTIVGSWRPLCGAPGGAFRGRRGPAGRRKRRRHGCHRPRRPPMQRQRPGPRGRRRRPVRRSLRGRGPSWPWRCSRTSRRRYGWPARRRGRSRVRSRVAGHSRLSGACTRGHRPRTRRSRRRRRSFGGGRRRRGPPRRCFGSGPAPSGCCPAPWA
ncbi:hypothetical protein OUZ56_032623, partial [Daphnia magna]